MFFVFTLCRDKKFPALGFGARLPPDGVVSHEFALVGTVYVIQSKKVLKLWITFTEYTLINYNGLGSRICFIELKVTMCQKLHFLSQDDKTKHEDIILLIFLVQRAVTK